MASCLNFTTFLLLVILPKPKEIVNGFRQMLAENEVDLQDFLKYYNKLNELHYYKNLSHVNIYCKWSELGDGRKQRVLFLKDALKSPDVFEKIKAQRSSIDQTSLELPEAESEDESQYAYDVRNLNIEGKSCSL